MTCREAQPHLTLFADGERSGVSALVAEHVRECPACAERVLRWQALRRATWAAVSSEPIPAGLAERVAGRLAAARGAERFRRVRLAGALAAAASLLLTLQFGLETPAATELTVQQFAEIHLSCAVRRHDQLGAASLGARDPHDFFRRAMAFRVCAARPERPYELAGACLCLRSNFIQALHLAYVDPARASEVLSVFSLDRVISLRGATVQSEHGRRYESAVRGGLTVLTWEDRQQSFAVCGTRSPADLTRLAEQLDVAMLFAESPALAHCDH